ncbi:MAG: hypothetical protein HYX32_00140 [Actinobacteria bacterium]|nr:hypothetical protein [Actinomycetota bacterium]
MSVAIVLTAGCVQQTNATGNSTNSATSAGTVSSTSSVVSSVPEHTQTASTAAPSTADPAAVRKLDFGNIKLESDACQWQGMDFPTQLVNGSVETGTAGASDYRKVSITQQPVFGEVTGDGREDAAFLTACNQAGSLSAIVAQVYSVDETGQPVRLASVPSPSGFAQPTELKAVALRASSGQQPAALVLTRSISQPGDPRCCPSGQDEVALVWNGTTFQPPAEPARLDQNSLSTSGIAPLRFGDTVANAESLTGKKAQPACGGGMPLQQITEVKGLQLWFADGKFSAYSVGDASFTTTSGVRVGMPIEEVKRRVPSAEQYFAGSELDASLVVKSGAYSVIFTIDDGLVRIISGGKNIGPRIGFC